MYIYIYIYIYVARAHTHTHTHTHTIHIFKNLICVYLLSSDPNGPWVQHGLSEIDYLQKVSHTGIYVYVTRVQPSAQHVV